MKATFTVRLADRTLERLNRRSRLSNQQPRSLAQRYIEEGLRHAEHPLVHFVDGAAGPRASLIGSGLDVWEVIEVVRDNKGNAAASADYLEVGVELVNAAVAYYGSYQDEIDAWIDANRQEAKSAHEAWLAGQRALGQ